MQMKVNIKSIFLIIFLGYFGYAFSIFYQSNVNYVPKSALIFLDDTESTLYTMSLALLKAVNQNTGPIICSASLLYNISSDFKKEEWILKNIDESIGKLYLLIPKKYLNDLKVSFESVSKYNPNSSSEVELKLGLKVNHMPLGEIENIEKPKEYGSRSDYFKKYFYDDDKKESYIFCINSDYYKNKQNNIPVWSISMEGHGEMETSGGLGRIVGISLRDFSKFLDFLESKINTQLFMYSSCYAAGLNVEKIYKASESAIQKAYSYAIITQAFTDAPTISQMMGGDYAKLLNEITKIGSIDYQKVIEYTSAKNLVQNEPQIKFPGTEWFSVIASPKNIVSIGSILSKARDRQKPLDVVSFFKTDPKVILFYAKNIPFELIINSKNLKSILSMIPGDAVHRINKISSTQNDIDQILGWFMLIDLLEPKKLFIIKEVNTAKNVFIFNQTKHLMGRYEQECYALYMQDGVIYKKERGSIAKEADARVQGLYENSLKRFVYNKDSEILGSFAGTDLRTFHQREASLLPSEITQEGVEKIKEAIEAHPAKVLKRSEIETDIQEVTAEEKIEEKPQEIDIITTEDVSDVAQTDIIGDKKLSIDEKIEEAARLKNYEKIKSIIKDEKNIINTKINNDPILIWAIKESSPDIVKLLLEKGVDVNQIDHEGRFLLDVAFLYNVDPAIINMLMQEGAQALEKEQNLFRAIVKKNFDAAKLFIEYGADVNAKDYRGESLLGSAIQYSSPEIIKLLIEKGADVKAKDISLDRAVEWRQPYEVMVLLDNRGTVIKDKMLILSRAIENNLSPETIDFLINKKGMKVNGPFQLLNTAVAKQAPLATIKLLVEAGANVNKLPESRIANAPKEIREYLEEQLKK